MKTDRDVTITLTDSQVARVVREASGGGLLAGLLAGLSDLNELQEAVRPLLDDETYSRSAFRTVLTLAAFPVDGSDRALTEATVELGYPAATTHREVRSLLALGLLEQDPHSRRYRRTQAPAK